VVSCIDFSKNYVMKVQNEIQDMHWLSFQMTVLVHITYQHNLDHDVALNRPEILKEVHYYVSNEKDHNTLFVQHAFRLHWEYLKSKRCHPK
jgi:hypothetical protein